MARKRKLDDLHLILLSTASQHDDGNVLPIAPSIAAATDRVAAALADLQQQKLIEEVQVAGAPFSREDGDNRYALMLTQAGYAAIGVSSTDAPDPSVDAAPAPNIDSAPAEPSSATLGSKSATVLALMERPDGATLAELVAATGWLPHTTRAALTGLRKKKHVIVRGKRGDTSCYHIQPAS